jgi:hypothetical protein
MVRVKTSVVRLEYLITELNELLRRYRNVRICWPGSKIHSKLGLSNEVILLRAWEKRPEPVKLPWEETKKEGE